MKLWNSTDFTELSKSTKNENQKNESLPLTHWCQIWSIFPVCYSVLNFMKNLFHHKGKYEAQLLFSIDKRWWFVPYICTQCLWWCVCVYIARSRALIAFCPQTGKLATAVQSWPFHFYFYILHHVCYMKCESIKENPWHILAGMSPGFSPCVLFASIWHGIWVYCLGLV